MLQDLRFTFRLLATERWFSTLGVIVLALGIGVNAIGFTIVNAAFLRGLPFKDADRLYIVSWQGRSGRRALSYAELQDWRSQTRAFTTLAAFRNDAMNLSDEDARAARASPGNENHCECVLNPRSAAPAWPRLGAGRRSRRRGSGRHHQLPGLEEPLGRGIPMSSGPRCA